MIFLYSLSGSRKSGLSLFFLCCLAVGGALCAWCGTSSDSGPAQRHQRSAQKGRGQSELEQPRSAHLLISSQYSSGKMTHLNMSISAVSLVTLVDSTQLTPQYNGDGITLLKKLCKTSTFISLSVLWVLRLTEFSVDNIPATLNGRHVYDWTVFSILLPTLCSNDTASFFHCYSMLDHFDIPLLTYFVFSSTFNIIQVLIRGFYSLS